MVSQSQLFTGGAIFSMLGLLHTFYSIRDLYQPRHLAPTDPALIDHMVLGGRRAPCRRSHEHVGRLARL
jgi:hypothetical protein